MSREAELYKDKIEVSLDGRQIFYLFFGGAVIVGLVFVLGVMVGRRVEARAHVDRASVAATVDPLAALDRLEGGNALSFQGALRGGDAPASDVEKTIAAMKNDAKAEKKKIEVDKGEPKVEPKPEHKVDKVDPKLESRPEAKVEKAAKVDDHKVAKLDVKPDGKSDLKVEKKPDAKSDAKPDAKTEAKIDAKTDVKAAAKIDAKTDAKTDSKSDAKKSDSAEVTKADAKKVDADKVADADKKPKFTLQLSSFQDKSDAQAYVENIKSAGYPAYVTEGAVEGKQYFRVRMGSYRSMDAANEAKAELERAMKKSAIVMKL